MTVILPIITILNRSALQVFDRHQLHEKGQNLHLYLLKNCATTCILGLIINYFISSLGSLETHFFSYTSLAWAGVFQIVSFAFSYNLRENPIREVMLTSKIADLLVTPFILFLAHQCLPSHTTSHIQSNFRLLPYLIAIISILPLYFKHHNYGFICKKSSLILIVAILIQFIAALALRDSPQKIISIENHWNLTLAIIIWRTLFSAIIYLLTLVNKSENFNDQFKEQPRSHALYRIGTLLFRAFLMILSYGTFILTIEYVNPLIALPILNSAPLVSSWVASLILNERLMKADFFALGGLCLSAVV